MTRFAESRPLATLLALVFLQVILLSVQVRTGEGQLLIRSWALALFSPVSSAASWGAAGLGSGWEALTGLWDARQENATLKAELTQLRLEVLQLRELRQSLPQSDHYERLRQRYSLDLRWGDVIWRSPSFFKQRAAVNLGSWDGVQRNAAVIAPKGVVGRVREAGLYASEIELITNPGASAGVLLGDLRIPAIVTGDGGALLWVDFLTDDRVVGGDLVVTSGSERIYPRGLPLGVVVHIDEEEHERRVWVKPSADLVRLENVAVILTPLVPSPAEPVEGEMAPLGGSRAQLP